MSDGNDAGSKESGSGVDKSKSGKGMMERLRSLNLVTSLGMVTTVSWVGTFLFPGLMYSWWLMLSMPAVAAFLFWTQKERTSGFERKVNSFGFWAVLLIFLLRDAYITAQRASLPEGFLVIQ